MALAKRIAALMMERLSDGLQPSKNAPLFYLINYLVHFRPELVQRIASPGDSPFDHQNTTVLCPLHVSQACEHTKFKKHHADEYRRTTTLGKGRSSLLTEIPGVDNGKPKKRQDQRPLSFSS